MMYKFTKNISCENSQDCVNSITKKLDTFFGFNISPKTKDDKVRGHFSCKHTNGNHIFWVALYEKNGVHESMSEDKIIKQKSDRVIKFTGTFPTESELKKAI